MIIIIKYMYIIYNGVIIDYEVYNYIAESACISLVKKMAFAITSLTTLENNKNIPPRQTILSIWTRKKTRQDR